MMASLGPMALSRLSCSRVEFENSSSFMSSEATVGKPAESSKLAKRSNVFSLYPMTLGKTWIAIEAGAVEDIWMLAAVLS